MRWSATLRAPTRKCGSTSTLRRGMWICCAKAMTWPCAPAPSWSRGSWRGPWRAPPLSRLQPPPTSRPTAPREKRGICAPTSACWGSCRAGCPKRIGRKREVERSPSRAPSCPTTSRCSPTPRCAGSVLRSCQRCSSGRCSNAARWFEFCPISFTPNRAWPWSTRRESYCRRKCARSSTCSLRGSLPRLMPRVSAIGYGPSSRKPRSDRTRAPSHQRSAPESIAAEVRARTQIIGRCSSKGARRRFWTLARVACQSGSAQRATNACPHSESPPVHSLVERVRLCPSPPPRALLERWEHQYRPRCWTLKFAAGVVPLSGPASSGQDQVSDLLWARDQGKVTCLHLHGRRVHAGCQKSLQVRRDRLVEFRDRIPGRFGAPGGHGGSLAEQRGGSRLLYGIEDFCFLVRDTVREIFEKGFFGNTGEAIVCLNACPNRHGGELSGQSDEIFPSIRCPPRNGRPARSVHPAAPVPGVSRRQNRRAT